MAHATRALPAVVQSAAFAVLTAVSRRRLPRRTEPLPPIGNATHLTAIVRLAQPGLSSDAYPGHYVYPAGTVHVTVTNLDRATRSAETAVSELSALRLPAPTFRVTGLGCARDTVFLCCLHDHGYARLRAAVRRAFGVPDSTEPAGWLFDRLSFANVVRFAGPAEWVRLPVSRTTLECSELEIVRTDRFLSDRGTTVLARLALTPAADLAGDSYPS